MFQTKVVEKIKTHILCSITSFLISCRLWDNVEKYRRAGQATDDNMTHAHFVLYNSGHRHTLTICNTDCCYTVKCLYEGASMLRHTYFACLVSQSELSQTVTPLTYFEGSGFESLLRHRTCFSWLRLLLLFLWSSVHHQFAVNYLDISFRASCGRLARIFVGSTPVNYLDNFRGTDGEYSRYLFWDVSLKIISTFCLTAHCEFSRI